MRIPKPDYFFVLMLYATGFNFHAAHLERSCTTVPICFMASQARCLLDWWFRWLNSCRWKKKNGLSTTELAREIFASIISATRNGHQGAALFFDIVYCDLHCLSVADSNGYWILISAVAVLAGEHMEKSKIARLVGYWEESWGCCWVSYWCPCICLLKQSQWSWSF